jgi:hypothetical protein
LKELDFRPQKWKVSALLAKLEGSSLKIIMTLKKHSKIIINLKNPSRITLKYLSVGTTAL